MRRIIAWFKGLFNKEGECNNTYIAKAQMEFKALGYPLPEECEEGPDKWVQENIIELLKVFSNQGHSGFSAPYVINAFAKLANHKPLGPVTGEDWEWSETINSEETLQNKRCSAVFKEKDGKAHYLDAIVFQGEDEWDSFTGRVEDIGSSQGVIFPFTPKTFYIDVYRELYDKDKHGEDARVVSCGSGDFVYFIKDRKQLDEVFEYYEKR